MGGGEKTTQQGSTNQTTTVTPDPSLVEANKLDLESKKQFQPTADLLNQNAANFINALFTGNIPALGGIFSQVAAGTAGQALDDSIGLGLNDVNNQLAKSGAGTFLESGASQSMGLKAATGMRQDAKQFDIGSFLNLANLAVGGQAQVQQPINSQNLALGGRLAGLSGTNTSGNFSSSTIGANPFMKSFQQSAGTGMGNVFNPQTWFKPGA